VLIVTLPMSRYQFVWPTFRQTTEAVCEALDAAWRFFEGRGRTKGSHAGEPGRLETRRLHRHDTGPESLIP
jgi:hypothetical protein